MMKPTNRRPGLQASLVPLTLLMALTAVANDAWSRGNTRVAFPEGYQRGVHYATVERGNIREEIFTSREAIDAAKKNQPLPSGTVITMEDYRDGRLFRYVVMEKRQGWGEKHDPQVRNGDWEFQSFAPDRSVNRSENVARCMGCHQPQGKNDFVFTFDQMRSANVSGLERTLRLVSAAPDGVKPPLSTHALAILQLDPGRLPTPLASNYQ